MVLDFVKAVFAGMCVLYIPGYCVLRACALPRRWALPMAPAVGVGSAALLATVLGFVGIACGPLTLLVLPSVSATFVSLIRQRRVHELCRPAPSWQLLAFYATVGLSVGAFVFLRSMPSLGALLTEYDSIHHLNGIRTFLDSKVFSSLAASSYYVGSDVATAPMIMTSTPHFYPAAWQAVCALVVQLSGVDIAVSVNAVNYLLASLVLPLCMAALMQQLFADRRDIVVLGGVASVAFAAFPWTFLIFGPLYPNLASFSTLPVGMMLVFIIGEGMVEGRLERRAAVLLALHMIGGVFVHPNGVFSLFLFVIIYGCSVVRRLAQARFAGRQALAWVLPGAYLATCFLLWYVVQQLPPVASVAAFFWTNYATFGQAIANVASLAYLHGFIPASAQIVLSMLVAVGLAWTLRARRLLWLSATYVITCIICIVNMTVENPLRHLLSGYWYNDPTRVSAMAALFAMPIAACGLAVVVGRVIAWLRLPTPSPRGEAILEGAISLALLAVMLMPIFSLPGLQTVLPEDVVNPEWIEPYEIEFETAFNVIRRRIHKLYAIEDAFISDDERQFVRDALELIPEDALVINRPFDGSMLAYGTEGMRTYYRTITGYGSPAESPESELIREHLFEIAERQDVRDAVGAIGADYVLLLDDSPKTRQFLKAAFDAPKWSGITSISDWTPGFEVVLARDNMRLYRIVA